MLLFCAKDIAYTYVYYIYVFSWLTVWTFTEIVDLLHVQYPLQFVTFLFSEFAGKAF